MSIRHLEPALQADWYRREAKLAMSHFRALRGRYAAEKARLRREERKRGVQMVGYHVQKAVMYRIGAELGRARAEAKAAIKVYEDWGRLCQIPGWPATFEKELLELKPRRRRKKQ